MNNAMARLLIGDIGGTHARLALLAPERGFADPIAEATRPSGRYDSLEALIRDFLGPASAVVDRAVFAVAGPVVEGRAVLTNLGWELREDRLRDELGVGSVRLLNDLHATAYAIPHLHPGAFHTLQRGRPERRGAMAVIAPGTGLGQAFLIEDGRGSYRAQPSEGGHADFAPADALQVELLKWMRTRHEHVSYERVCSGRALPDLYAFLNAGGAALEEEWLAARLAKTDNPAPVIIDAALEAPGSPLCVAVLELFAAILAAEAGNMALRILATGGVCLAGGLPPRVLPILERGAFLTAFCRKGRVSGLLARVPLHVLVEPRAGLLGAFHYGIGEG